MCLGILAATVAGHRASSALPALTSRFGPALRTLLPAAIEPAQEFDVLAQYAGTVKKIYVSPGSQIREGESLILLENDEVISQAASASKRVEMATLRLKEARAGDSTSLEPNSRQERLKAALGDQRAAGDRLAAFSTEDQERSLSVARRRATEVNTLLRRGLATEAELQNALAQESAASRDLKTAQEHLSRLAQEFEQTKSQVLLLQIELAEQRSSFTAVQADVGEARANLALAEGRMQALSVPAPGAGTVLEIPVRNGQWVPTGVRLARIADLSALMISAPVSASVAGSVPAGTPVSIRLPTEPPSTYDARVDSVTAVPDSTQRAYLIRVLIPNPNPAAILVGLEASIEIRHLGRK